MTDAALLSPLDLPLLLLAGEVTSRPQGLERALTRAGFRVSEGTVRDASTPPDAILLTLGAVKQDTLADLLRGSESSPPRVILFSEGDPDRTTTALDLGADDAMMSPVHLPELCARIHARIRDRQAPRRTPYERQAREALETLVAEARNTLLPDEVVLALVRRLSRAFELAACSFVTAEAGERGRVVAEVGCQREPDRLDLRQHPEILQAIRARRPATMTGAGNELTVVLPVGPPDAGAVLLLRPQQGRTALAPAQLALASTLGEAALRALSTKERGDAGSLDRRLEEEFERARRYSLSFSLVLVALDALHETAARLDEPTVSRLVADVTVELRRALRLPDFVSRYAPEGFAIVLPETDVAGARRSVGRIRDRLAMLPLEAEGLSSEVSVGIAGYPHPAISQPDDMFALVEAALRRGRARTGERIGIAE